MEENKNLPQKSQSKEARVTGEETQLPTGDTGDETPPEVNIFHEAGICIPE